VAQAAEQAGLGARSAARAEFDWHAGGGLSLMERMIGYQRVVVIDALQTECRPVGSVHCCRLEALPDLARGHLVSAHETSLQAALELGRRLQTQLPEDIIVIGVEARPVLEFTEGLSPPVAAAVPAAVALVERLLQE
jgi:hydrogenase maturation protease